MKKKYIFDKSHHLPVIQLQLTTNGAKKKKNRGLEGYIKIFFLDDIQMIATTNLPLVLGLHFLSEGPGDSVFVVSGKPHLR